MFENEDLCLGNSIVSREFHRNKSASNCHTNYKHDVSTKSYKKSTLCGEIQRVNNCTSLEPNLKKPSSTKIQKNSPRSFVQ